MRCLRGSAAEDLMAMPPVCFGLVLQPFEACDSVVWPSSRNSLQVDREATREPV